MAAEIDLSAELEDLKWKCSWKREALFKAAVWQRRAANVLQMCAGVSALLSAFISTATVFKIISSTSVQILSASLSFASALITLAGNVYARKKDRIAMLKGAAAFLIVRHKIVSDRSKFGEDRVRLLETLNKRYGQYKKISTKYDGYLSKLPGVRK